MAATLIQLRSSASRWAQQHGCGSACRFGCLHTVPAWLCLVTETLAAAGWWSLATPFGGLTSQPPSLPGPQHAREEKLAVLLGALLRRYVEGDVEGFQVTDSILALRLE